MISAIKLFKHIQGGDIIAKLSWKKILTDFKQRHPHLSKEISHWCPHDYATILIYLKDGMKLTYDYEEHKAVILGSRWK